MSTAKGKVILKVFGDFFTVGKNVVKYFKGNPNVSVSSVNAAKNAGKIPKSGTRSSVENASTLGRIKRGSEYRKAGEAIKELGKKSKVKLRSDGPLASAGSRTGAAKKTGPWSTSKTPSTVKSKTTSSTQAQRLRDADVTKGTKITPKNATVGKNVYKAGKKAGVVVMSGGKKFIRTKTGALIAIGSAAAGLHYIGKAIDKKIAGTNGAVTKPKPPKPSAASSTTGLVTTAPAPPSVLSAQEQAANQTKPPKPKPPKPSATLMSGRPPDRKSRDVAADMRHFAISRGGTEKDPNRGFRRRLFGENVTEAEAAKDMKESYKAEQADRKKISQQDFYQYGEGRRSQLKGKQGKKKGGSVIKRNKGGPVRGVGKALRGYGNNSIYSNKMY